MHHRDLWTATLAMTAAVLLATAAHADEGGSAAEQLRRAGEARATWGPAFPGFTAEATIQIDGEEPVRGSVRVGPDGRVRVEAPEGPARDWAADQLRSEVMHRIGRDRGDATPEAEFVDEEGAGTHPLGRHIRIVGDRFQSSFRVDGDEVREVNRTMGASRFSIRTLATERNAEGKSLPLTYTVTYWDADDGALDRVETFGVTWARVGAFDLPATRTQVLARDGSASVRRLILSNHVLDGAGRAESSR